MGYRRLYLIWRSREGTMKGFLLGLGAWFLTQAAFAVPDLRTGDLVFQSEPGNFAKAIQVASRSPYNHVGMVFVRDGKPYIYEAVGPVRFTSLEEFAKRGIDGRYTVKRLKDADKVLTPAVLKDLEGLTKEFKGRAYSQTFGWDDKTMYCSELVWKMYQRSAGLKIGELKRLKDFDLSHPVVKKEMAKRFGGILPFWRKILSPGAMAESGLLEPVVDH
jgi:hypothetical protein